MMSRKSMDTSAKGQCIFLLLTTIVPVGIYICITIYDAVQLETTDERRCPMIGMFPCGKNSSTCIEQSQWCDGHVDCPGKEDEDQEKCRNALRNQLDTFYRCTLWMPSFDHYKKNFWETNRMLDDAHHRQSICSQWNFPDNCTCSRRRVNCSNLQFNHIPAEMSAGINELNIGNNQITELKDKELWKFRNLSTLILNNNRIVRLESGTFETLSELIRLYVSGNRLISIAPGAFNGLKKLSILVLDYNQLHSLPTDAFAGLDSLCHLQIRHNKLTLSSPDVMYAPPSCSVLDLAGNRIRNITTSTFRLTATKLSVLLLQNNSIDRIDEGAFASLPSLLDVDLTNNKLTSLPRHFQEAGSTSSIQFLSLAKNPISELEVQTFSLLHHLKSLNLSEVRITRLPSTIFKPLKNLTYVEFSSFDMCRYAPMVKICKPISDGISSIRNLLDITFLRISIWIVAMVTCFGNAFVIVCRMLFREEKNVHSLFIKNLAAADFILGIYLLVVATHDVLFRNQYNVYALQWMEGRACQTTGYVAVLSCEVSVFILTCMSIECCLTVSFPLQPQMMTIKRAMFILIVIWILGALLAAIPMTSASLFGQFYGSNGVCLPLYIHDPYLPGWEYSAVVFIGLNLLAMVVIAACYTGICCSLRRTRAASVPVIYVQGNSDALDTARQDLSMAKRFFVIVLTNVLCWIPVTTIKIMALNDVKISDNFYAWLTVFVLPINSALNPIIYSITTPSFRIKFRNQFCCKMKIPEVFTFGHISEKFNTTKKRRRNSSKTSATNISLLMAETFQMIQRHRSGGSNRVDSPIFLSLPPQVCCGGSGGGGGAGGAGEHGVSRYPGAEDSCPDLHSIQFSREMFPIGSAENVADVEEVKLSPDCDQGPPEVVVLKTE